MPYTEDTAKANIYNIYYTVQLADYATVYVDQVTPFAITIVDPCDTPTTLELDVSTPLIDKEYTVGTTP